jgi:hypothetical protein
MLKNESSVFQTFLVNGTQKGFKEFGGTLT